MLDDTIEISLKMLNIAFFFKAGNSGKIVNSSNAHSPHHSNHSNQQKKAIQLCLDPKDLNNSLEREPHYCRTIGELISV